MDVDRLEIKDLSAREAPDNVKETFIMLINICIQFFNFRSRTRKILWPVQV